MQIQKLNSSIYSNRFITLGNSASKPLKDSAKPKEKKDYEIFKEVTAESFLLAGLGFASGDIVNSKDIANNASKPYSIGDKILFGIMAACLLVTAVQAFKAIKHYICDKRNNII